MRICCSWLEIRKCFSDENEERNLQPGEVWRILVQPYPGPEDGLGWVEVLIPQGQATYHFAARRELGIPGAAPMSYVSDEGPARYLLFLAPGFSHSPVAHCCYVAPGSSWSSRAPGPRC